MQYDKDLKSDHRHLFLKVRELLLEDKGVSEQKKERITTYLFGGSGLCHVRTMPNGVDIGFLKGAQFQDKFGLLQGRGKKMRVFNLKQYNEQKLGYHINQAKQING